MAPTIDRAERLEAEESATVTSSIGTVVAGTYRLTRHIGSGGSSHVFEAEHVRLGKPFAVKLLRPELDPTRQTAQRFRREARAIARLRNEYIVSVVDCGELADKTPYLVMELLEGEDLRSLLKREGSLPARRAVPLVVEACRALTEAHGAGLVHRDLKPENLFITRRATGEDWCKVLDFGVAKMDASLATTQGAIVGTVRYMAPEQLADGGNVGVASDIYALGAILYECLSGRPAHEGETIQSAMFSVLNKEPPPLVEVPQALNTLVLRCLSKDPAQRPPGAHALGQVLAATVRPGGDKGVERTLTEDDSSGLSVPQSTRSARKSSLLWPVALGAVLSISGLGWLRSTGVESPAARPHGALGLKEPASPVPTPSVASSAPGTLVTPAVRVVASDAAPVVSAGSSVAKSRPARIHGVPRTAVSPGPSVVTHTDAPTRVPTVGNLDAANPYSE